MDTRLRSSSRAMLLLGLGATIAGCAQTTPGWDSSFGNSVRSTFAAQVINPGAVRNTNPVTGIDGRAAQAAQEKYEAGASNGNGGQEAMPISLVNGGGIK